MTAPRRPRKLARVIHMPVVEIADRLRQIASQLGERLSGAVFHDAPPIAESHAHPPTPGLREPGRVAALIRAICPREVESTITNADRILRGEVELLGHGWVFVGDPPNWTTDPLTGRVAPDRHWSRIRYLDPTEVGDSKRTWELNRHQHLVQLGQAWRLTGDDRYADHAWRSLMHWIGANPPGRGINWASSLEVAFRAIAWCWLWHLADGGIRLPPVARQTVLRALAAHGRHMERYLSTYFSPNTHLTGEALGLCYLATAWPDGGRSRQWWTLGNRILARAIVDQIRTDGLHFERSSCYHLYTLDYYLHFALLHLARGKSLPDPVRSALARLADIAVLLRTPGGHLPALGDEDGGRLLGFGFGRPLDPSTSLAVAAALLDDARLRPENVPVSVTWLLGVAAANALLVTNSAAPRPGATTVRTLHESGLVVARREPDDFLMVSAGLQETRQVCLGHVHDDAGSLELWCDGAAVFLDPGTYTYTQDPMLRQRYRSAAAHSTVTIDDCPLPPTAGPFQWHHLDGGEVAGTGAWDSGCGVDLKRVITVPGGAVIHRRWVLMWWGIGCVIWDRFLGHGSRTAHVRFQLAPNETPLTDTSAGLMLGRVVAMAVGSCDTSIESELLESPVAPVYGQLVPSRAWRITARGDLPMGVLTVVLHRPPSIAFAQDLRRTSMAPLQGSAEPPRGGLLIEDVKSGWKHELFVQDAPTLLVPAAVGTDVPAHLTWIHRPSHGADSDLRLTLNSADFQSLAWRAGSAERPVTSRPFFPRPPSD